VPHPASARPAPRFPTVLAAGELGILLALSVIFPFMIHVIPVPQDAQLGSRLLPIFYAPLLAVLLGRVTSAWLVAMLAPWLNWALTSHPSPLGAIVMEVELAVFVLVARKLLSAAGPPWYVALPAYLCGMIAAVLAASIFPALIGGRPALSWGMNSVAIGLPGLAVFVLITCLVSRHYPPGAGGEPMAA